MDIKVPDLGVDSAEVAEVFVKVGDMVNVDDALIAVESDKASVEVPSTLEGKVVEILVGEGDSVSQGDVIVRLDSGSSEESQEAPTAIQEESSPAQETSATKTGPSSQTHDLPDLGVDSAEVAEVFVKVGDTINEGDAILAVESDKASVEVPAPATGIIEAVLVEAGDTVANGQAFVIIKGEGSTNASTNAVASSEPQKQPDVPKQEPAPKKETTNAPAPGKAPSGKLNENQVNASAKDVHAGPAVRKLAREFGVDLSLVKGTATHGRIVKEDLVAYVKSVVTGKAVPTSGASAGTQASLPALPDMSNSEIWGETETKDLSRLQKASIPNFNYNNLIPQVTQFDASDITDTEALRSELKGKFKEEGVSLTILAFIIKAAGYALQQFPKFNSHLSDDNTQLILRKACNIGIAVATDDGLVVPVIRNVQDKGIKEIAVEVGELAKKARNKKLAAKDMQGASFTVSSLGNLGGTNFTPLVAWPQVAILGVAEASYQPKWDEKAKAFEPRLTLPLSVSYDHRVINGADAAQFTRLIATLLSDVRRILL